MLFRFIDDLFKSNLIRIIYYNYIIFIIIEIIESNFYEINIYIYFNIVFDGFLHPSS